MMKQLPVRKLRELAEGFHLKSAEVSEADKDRFLRSSDVWEVLAGVLLSCQSGNFGELPRIPKLLRRNDGFLFWKAATELLGCSGTWSFIEQFILEFRSDMNDRGVQFFLPVAIGNCCSLWAVEPLLTLYTMPVGQDGRDQIHRYLSCLLEEENGLIWMGPEEMAVVVESEEVQSEDLDFRTVADLKSYAEDVRAARDKVVERVGSTEKPVFEGNLLDIAATAERLYKRLVSIDGAKGRIYQEKLIFEASTGVDCSIFFDDKGRLQYLAAAALMETFLESDAVGRFEPGQRYFFGHPIPD